MLNLWNSLHPEDPMPEKGYVIHHKDENPENNDPDNLEKIKREEHSKLHHTGITFSLTEKQKKAISKRQQGENNSFYGKKHSEETKEHWSKIRTGRKQSEKSKQKISEANKGKILSFETKRKIAEARKNYTGENHPRYGRKHSEESKKKISESTKGRIPWNKGLRYGNSK